MKIPLSWLRDFIEITETPEELREVFDDLGLVVEGVELTGQNIDAVLVAKVLEIHPIDGADRIRRVIIEAGEVAFLAVRVKKTKDRYDYVYDDDGAVVGVQLVQVFDATGATFSDEKTVGKKIQKTVDAIIADEAERKRGQMSFEVPEGVPMIGERALAEREKYGDLASQVDEALGGGA